ncbi:MAG: polysaccharide biosynthesis tyrosine autokinase [Deltaproteobacteria bacterium]|nr:polysaccharide biosynthesis tyrosine autokinase [Deltaproteobacteria bacterium]
MSHIEKALEKAAKERSNTSEGKAPANDSAEALNPVYTETRSVVADNALLAQNRVVTLNIDPVILEQYNILKTQVLQRTRKDSLNTIMITSARPGEGKTLTAVNLAISLAREINQTVLLVDADFRPPSLHKYFGLPVEPGLTDYLFRNQALPGLLVNPGIAKLTVLPAGKPASDSVEHLGSPRMKALVEEMKTRYPDRYIIFDCSPLLTHADPLIFAQYVDAIILVVEAGTTSEHDIREAAQLLSGRNVIGTVLNKTEMHGKAYQSAYSRTG